MSVCQAPNVQHLTPKRRFVVLVACLVLATVSGRAQETTGIIEGAVTDRTSSAFVGARVIAINLETGFTKETATTSDGFYRLLLLPVGQYTVTVEAPRFATLVREAIRVNLGQTIRRQRTAGVADARQKR